MFWIIPAIASHFLWAMTNVGDKYIVSNRVQNPYVYLSWYVLIGLISLVLAPFIGFQVPGLGVLGGLIAAGILFLLGNLFFYKSLQLEEVTRVNIWWCLLPLFSLLISAVTVHDPISTNQIIAIALLVSASAIGALHGRQSGFSFSRAFPLMVLACLLLGGYGVIFHQLTKTISFAVGFVWINLVMGACVVLVLGINRNFRRQFIFETKAVSSGGVLIILAINLVDKLATLINHWALSLQISPLVFAMEGTQGIFVFGIALLISWKNPNIVREKFDARNVLLKLVAIVLVGGGIVLLSV